MKTLTMTRGAWIAATVVVMSTACGSSQPTQTRFMSDNTRLRAAAAEVRVVVRARNEVVDHALERLQRTVLMSLGLTFVGALIQMMLWRWIGRPR